MAHTHKKKKSSVPPPPPTSSSKYENESLGCIKTRPKNPDYAQFEQPCIQANFLPLFEKWD